MYGKYKKRPYKGKKKYYTPAEKRSYYAGLRAGKARSSARKSRSGRW